MTYIEALIYALVQGFSEYLPISSSAHLVLLPRVMQTREFGLTFDVFLHAGTLFSTLVYFRKDWMDIGRSFLRSLKFKVRKPQSSIHWKHLVVATIPAVIAGLTLHQWIRSQLRGTEVIVVTLSLGGILLFLVDHFKSKRRSLKGWKLKDALYVGFAQCFALVPGVSRSAATMIGGRLLGLNRKEAARFSFLMLGPVTFAAVVFELRHWSSFVSGDGVHLGPLLVAGFGSFVFGMTAIHVLLSIVSRWSYLPFAIYRVVLAGAVYLWV